MPRKVVKGREQYHFPKEALLPYQHVLSEKMRYDDFEEIFIHLHKKRRK
jgi:hypothetical protein